MYAISRKRQLELLARLRPVPSSAALCETQYVDPATNEEWVGFYPFSECQGGGPLYLRTKTVPADWREWINLCLESSEPDDAIGLAFDLRAFSDQRDAIVSFLEVRWPLYPAIQRRTFIEKLTFPRDVAALVGKHVSEIDREWAREKQLLARLDALKKKA